MAVLDRSPDQHYMQYCSEHRGLMYYRTIFVVVWAGVCRFRLNQAEGEIRTPVRTDSGMLFLLFRSRSVCNTASQLSNWL